MGYEKVGADGPVGRRAACRSMKDAAFRDHVASLKAAVGCQEVAAALNLPGRGKRFFCPACQADGGRHRTPDLSVTAKGFACFKCGQHGDVIDLAVLAGRMTKADAIAYLEGLAGIRRPDRRAPRGQTSTRRQIARPGASWRVSPIPKPVASHSDLYARQQAGLYAAFLADVCRPVTGTPGGDYLKGRGIDASIAERFGVRFCPDLSGLWTLADRKVIKAAGLAALYVFQKAGLPFLVFPYTRRGTPVFIKSRCLLSKDEAERREVPRFLNTGGIVPCLWNHDAVADADRVIIAEGEVDALSAIVAGYVGVGLPGWSHWKDAWTRDFTGKDVFLVMDADEAGRKGTADIARRFRKSGLPYPRQLVLDEGTDLNDVLRESMKDGNQERRKA